jgi:hypothetical protein
MAGGHGTRHIEAHWPTHGLHQIRPSLVRPTHGLHQSLTHTAHSLRQDLCRAVQVRAACPCPRRHQARGMGRMPSRPVRVCRQASRGARGRQARLAG